MTVRRSFCAIVLMILLSAARVAADPAHPCTPSEPCHLRMREDTTIVKDNGDQYRIPPGHFLDEPTFVQLDVEMRRLQDQETRLTAENKSLRASAESWQPGWFTLMTAIVVGAGLGVGGYYYATHN